MYERSKGRYQYRDLCSQQPGSDDFDVQFAYCTKGSFKIDVPNVQLERVEKEAGWKS